MVEKLCYIGLFLTDMSPDCKIVVGKFRKIVNKYYFRVFSALLTIICILLSK